MDAVIVAAGAGTRMQPLTLETHKCLLPVNGRPLIEYSLDTLKAHGINRIFVVTGHCDDQMRRALEPWVYRFIVNPFYQTTNNMASLWFAHHYIEDDFLYLHADLLYDPGILTNFLAHPFSYAAICMEEKQQFFGEEMKVGVEGEHLILGKGIPDERAIGEFIGIAGFRKDRYQTFVEIMTSILMRGEHNTYFAEAIAIASLTHEVDIVPFAGQPWIEVDTADDLEKARTEVFSQIFPTLSSVLDPKP